MYTDEYTEKIISTYYAYNFFCFADVCFPSIEHKSSRILAKQWVNRTEFSEKMCTAKQNEICKKIPQFFLPTCYLFAWTVTNYLTDFLTFLPHPPSLPPPPEYGEGVVSAYRCCQERRDSAGCQVAKVGVAMECGQHKGVWSLLFPCLQMHVTAGTMPTEEPGYVQTSSSSSSSNTVYALDCEMCYTTVGLELTRVSLVDMFLQPVFESLILPPHPIVDYNTR